MVRESIQEQDIPEVPILPESVPVIMPDLPLSVSINTAPQIKAISDPVRLRILGIIRHQPATAKQIAGRLGATPGAIGHHLHVLEAAGLAQVVARRVTRGIIAKYYTRTARIFDYDMPRELAEYASVGLRIITSARDELAESIESYGEEATLCEGFPHARLSQARADYYQDKIQELIREFLMEPVDPQGEVFGMALALFKAPAWQAPLKEDEK